MKSLSLVLLSKNIQLSINNDKIKENVGGLKIHFRHIYIFIIKKVKKSSIYEYKLQSINVKIKKI